MHLKDLIMEYGQEKGNSTVRLDETGHCHLLINNEITLSFEVDEEKNRFYMYALVGMVGPQYREKLFEEILSADLYNKETGGATLGLDKHRDEIILSRYFSLTDLDYVDFKRFLESFLGQVTHWKQYIQDFRP